MKIQREETRMRTASKDEPFFERRWIDKEFALAAIARNTHNRSQNRRLIERLTLTIERDEFIFNGQPIVFAKDGTLLDGQHRLMAVIEANKTIDTLIVWNAEPASQETMDMGNSRSVADILRLRGFPNQHMVAAVGKRVALGTLHGFQAGAAIMQNQVSAGKIVSIVEALSELERYTAYARSVAKVCNLIGSQVGFLMWWFDGIDRTDSDYFWEKLRTGRNLDEGDPIYALRRFGQLAEHSGMGTFAHQYFMAAMIVKAWNKFRQGEPVMRLTFRAGGANPEEFPQPV